MRRGGSHELQDMTLATMEKLERPYRATPLGEPAWQVAFLFLRQANR
jgi:hypothetical protein